MFGVNLCFGILNETALILIIILLHLILPGERTTGYCCNNQFQPLLYKLNGLSILILVTVGFFVSPEHVQVYFAENFFYNLFGANVIGIFFSILLYLRGGHEPYARCITIDQISVLKSKSTEGVSVPAENKKKVSNLERFYLGCEWNPRFLDIDSKMILYIIGAVHLQINILSFAAKEYYQLPQPRHHSLSLAFITYLLLFSLFLYDYMFFEKIHLYTYDLFAEKLGFKLTWGCLVFYPFFYCIGVHCLVTSSFSTSPHQFHDTSQTSFSLIILLYLFGWFLTRGANLQKYYFKINSKNSSCFFGFIQQTTLPNSNNKILCSGFWGLARHINYAGEIIQSIALTLPGLLLNQSLLFSFNQHNSLIPHLLVTLSLLYPLFYILLFISRQSDDDHLCQLKYGDVWKRYQERVPWRIFPFVW